LLVSQASYVLSSSLYTLCNNPKTISCTEVSLHVIFSILSFVITLTTIFFFMARPTGNRRYAYSFEREIKRLVCIVPHYHAPLYIHKSCAYRAIPGRGVMRYINYSNLCSYRSHPMQFRLYPGGGGVREGVTGEIVGNNAQEDCRTVLCVATSVTITASVSNKNEYQIFLGGKAQLTTSPTSVHRLSGKLSRCLRQPEVTFSISLGRHAVA
jgi:hypothetical protein